MRGVDFHRSRRAGQLPFLITVQPARLIFNIRCGLWLNCYPAEWVPNLPPLNLHIIWFRRMLRNSLQGLVRTYVLCFVSTALQLAPGSGTGLAAR